MGQNGTDHAPTRPRGVEIHRLSAARRLVIGAERVGRRRPAMHCLMTIDVTAARGLIAASPTPVSFTAFLAASVARVAAEHPAVHAYRDWRGRLVTHRHVDVTILVETETPQGPVATPTVVHDADIRDVAEISAELRAVKAELELRDAGRTGVTDRFSRLMAVPGLLRALYAVLDRSVRARQRIGTVVVTSVGFPGAGGGFGIAPLTLMPLQVVVGGISRRPHETGRMIDEHELLDLTVSFDHDVVDGAPAARFVARLRDVIEKAELLRPASWSVVEG